MRELDANLYVLDLPFSMPGGIQLGTRTTIVRLANGDLFVHSPGPVGPDERREVAALGPVRYLVAPNLFHHLYVKEWAAAFPDAVVHAAPGLGPKLEGLDPTELASDAPAAWSAELDQIAIQGAPRLGEIVFLHRPSRTLLLTDLCFHVRHSESRLTRVVLRLMGAYGRFGPSRLARSFIKDRAAVRAGVDALLEWDFDRVIVTHGDVLEEGGRDALREAYAWLRA